MIKTKIKYLLHDKQCRIEKHGEWLDLRTQIEVNMKPWEFKVIPLGITIDMPKYHEAHILPRSGTYGNFGITMANSQGVIEFKYKGMKDVLKFGAKALDLSVHIDKYDRICQFRVQLTQDAPWWVKLKWVFSKYIFEEVHVLHNKSRGGFGSTGVK